MTTARTQASRREFLKGKLHNPREEVHISSLVVHAFPKQLSDVKSAIEDIPNTEIHASSDQGKLVVVLETENEHLILERIDQIGSLPGVITTSMIYHQVDDSELNH